MAYKVYCWINKLDGKRYIGCTSKTVEERAGSRMIFYRNNQRFSQAIKTDGYQNFEYEILVDDLTAEEAADWERYYIAAYDTTNPEKGYNIFRGGYHTYTAEQAFARSQKIAATLQKQRNNDEWRAGFSKRMKANWQDPKWRAEMLDAAEKGNGGGVWAPVRVYCRETNTTYRSMMDAAKALGVSQPVIAGSFRRDGGMHTVVGMKKGTPYHLSKVSPA